MASTFPPGQVSTLGLNLLKENRAPHITYVAPNGTKFYLAGPLAPTVGAQTGVALQSVLGLTPPFRHIDNQGARQDGTTWMDTVYEPGEIDMVLEASAINPAQMRALLRSWQGAWNPKEPGRLHVFTPEMGEWWAQVRHLKSFTDPITYSHTKSGGQKFTWAARNDDSFWESFDSVGSFRLALSSASDTFNGSPSSTLGSNWNQLYSSTASTGRTWFQQWEIAQEATPAGTYGRSGDGSTRWNVAGYLPREVINRYITGSSTDNQVITVQIRKRIPFDIAGGVYFDIWGRMDAYGNGVRARIGPTSVTLSCFTGGTSSVNPTEKKLWWEGLLKTPWFNEKWTLICGTTKGERNFKVQRGGRTVVNFTENGTTSPLGSSYRGWGFGGAAGPGSQALNILQIPPPDILMWEAGDNLPTPTAQSGYIPLVNRGDVEAWPRYLVTGPGTFTFSDGDKTSTNTVTFGPLLEDQTVLITTLPRLRSVVDLSPAVPQQELTKFQQKIANLVDLATNGNVPPLLEQFESKFGILPPQGPLYSLLTNRFTTPLPAKDPDSAPVVSNIAVSIVDGNADSKVIAAITPRRRWPM